MKTLAQVVEQVQSELGLSKNKLSLKIGKSRNYLSEMIRVGVSAEKEQEIINLLLELIDDEVKFLRNQVAALEQEKLQRHRELVDYENKCENTIDNLNETIATKDLFIDGLEKEIKVLEDKLEKKQESLDSVAKSNKNLITKNKNLKDQVIKLKEIVNQRGQAVATRDNEIKKLEDQAKIFRKEIDYRSDVNLKNKNLEHQITILKKDLDYKEGVIQKQNNSKKDSGELGSQLKEKYELQGGVIRELEEKVYQKELSLSRENRNHNVTRVAGLISSVALLILLLIK